MNIAFNMLYVRIFIIILLSGIFGLFVCATAAQSALKADSLKQLISKANHDTVRVMNLLNLSRLYKTSDRDSAIFFANEALDIAELSKFPEGIAKACTALGDAEVSRDSITRAIYYYNKAIAAYNNIHHESDIAELYLVLGSLYTYQDNLFGALDCFQKSLTIAEKLHSKNTQAKAYNNLGSVYKILEKYDQALDCFNSALGIYEELGEEDKVLYLYGNLGILHAMRGDKELAETYFKKTLQIGRESKDEVVEAFALVSLGDFNMDIKNFEEALSYYNQALEMAGAVDSKYSGPKALFYANLYSGIGSAYYYLKNYDLAIKNLSAGFDKASETGQLTIVAESADKLSRAYEMRNQAELALKYARIHQSVSDSIMNDDMVRRITELDMQYKFDKVIAEREFQQALTDAAQKRNRMIYMMTIGGAFLGLIIFLLLFLLQKNKVKRVELSTMNLELEKENLTNDLDYKNKELTTNVMYLLKKNELILNVLGKLKKAKMNFKVENRVVVEDVIRELESASKGDMWKEFELRFQEVHSDFYSKLNELFPNLTPNELKLCAFLRLNMSTKDIAAITFLSVNGINIARHRLRKKLNIDKDENLIIFLSNL
ncbi:MAG: tetratricopeptide repeat protein [Clostridia bacterium]|nr:tetratricopeptide repeat protein [Clostridia bacterium]